MIQRILLGAFISLSLFAQGGRGGGAIPALSEQQRAVLMSMTADLASQAQAVTRARTALTASSFAAQDRSEAIHAAADAAIVAEVVLANARAAAFAKIQASPAKLAPNQVAALIAAGGTVEAPQPPREYQGGGGLGTIPNIRETQVTALTRMSTDVMPLTRSLTPARAAMTVAAFAEPPNAAAIQTKAEELKKAELAVAEARAESFAKIQTSGDRLAPAQVASFIAMGGSFAGVGFSLPEPLNFAEHEGYVSIFDGVSLKDWDGNPKFWRVEDGAIVGESTPQNPSGNSYIAYRGFEAKDFTLKFEIKVEGTGGSGFQYRSKTGLPWVANIADNVTANVGPVNLNWMMTGPQADFWPSSRDWTGQFYSENTPMRVLAWRGQVVEGSGLASKQLMGNIGDRAGLGALTKLNDWNQYTVIARGGTCMHILNGQLMAVMVDDDPASSNNQSGLFGIEIEATTKVYVRNIWVKKLN